ncbi:MAG: hypothetical protein J6F30_07635 [Cellulosilyticum sp.]|nr:hypothetical protein [Cellulosilyticum sp.]
MQKIGLKNIGINICVSYTMISIGVHLYEMIGGMGDINQHLNGVMMFFCTAVAVCCLSLYYVLEDWTPLLVIIMQYIIAVAIVLGVTYIIGRFNEVSPGGYFDMWRSFTTIYVVGALWYYIEIWLYVRKQNKWLEEVKQEKKEEI